MILHPETFKIVTSLASDFEIRPSVFLSIRGVFYKELPPGVLHLHYILFLLWQDIRKISDIVKRNNLLFINISLLD